MKNAPAGISESFGRLRFSFPVAGFFGGRLRPDKGTQVPENSLNDDAAANCFFFQKRSGREAPGLLTM